MSFLILLALKHFIALRPAQNGWHLQTTIWMHFLEWKFRISAGIYLKYIPESPWQRTLVQIITWRRTGDKPLPETTMTPHPPLICLTQHQWPCLKINGSKSDCPACRTTLIATRFWVVMICPIIKCLTVLEFSFILFDLCLFITIFNFIFNYVPIVTFWIFTYHKILILLIIFCFIWSYWIIHFLTCLEVFWSVVS